MTLDTETIGLFQQLNSLYNFRLDREDDWELEVVEEEIAKLEAAILKYCGDKYVEPWFRLFIDWRFRHVFTPEINY